MLSPRCNRENPTGAALCISCSDSLETIGDHVDASRQEVDGGAGPPRHRNNAPEPSSTFDTSFFGRHQEMEELRTALQDALSSRGRLVMLVGEPGSGKSRTSQELASYASQDDALVFWGRCYENPGAPP